jgi:cytochrome c5
MAFLFAVSCASCEKTEPTPAPAPSAESITLPQANEPLPEGPGRAEFAASCLLCHSFRYVTMQPRFSKKVWTAEVEKMNKAYGAPISPDQAAKIVEYLVTINGTP